MQILKGQSMKKMIRLIMIMPCIVNLCSYAFAEEKAVKHSPATQYFLDHITGNMALTNNYTFRGLSQTKEESAVQGGLTFTFDSKIYLSLWGSNVDFLSPNGDQATLETDEIIGYSNTIKDFTFDLHVERYSYPRASSATYNEITGSMGYKFLTFLMAYSGNVFGSHGPGTYTNLSANFDIPAKYVYFDDVKLSGGIGNYNLDRNAGNSYMDYNVQLAKMIAEKYVLSIQWVDTNHKNPPYDGCQWVVAVIANF
jgi:uncharacterized protein (TIGR02001 family)